MRRNFLFHRMPTRSLSLVNLGFSSLLLWVLSLSCLTHAQTPPITPSGLNTQVSGPIAVSGKTQFDITGGTRAGTNLFHSFGQFNVPNNNIANFLNEPSNPATSNILGRVTGGNLSNIFGTIQTTGFGNANLFLMNPAGFLFGPSATVNIGGMVAFTSADYLRLQDIGGGNAGIFHADPAQLSVLTSAPVAAFGFLGSNPGAITVQGSQFAVTEGSGISLVGGDITIERGTLIAPAGRINLAAVGSSGEILAGALNQAPNINGQSFGNLGTIQISEESVFDVSGDGGGTVAIRGGRLVIDESTITANITGPGPVVDGVESIGGGIDILVSQDTVIQNEAVLETNVVGNATPGIQYGGVRVEANRIEMIGVPDFENVPFTGIRSGVAPESTGGNSGDIHLKANSIQLIDLVFLDTTNEGLGNAGNITVEAIQNLDLGNAAITSGPVFAPGDAGNIILTSTEGNITSNLSFVTSQTILSPGTAGKITINAPNGDIQLTDSNILTAIRPEIGEDVRAAGSGAIQVVANDLQLNGTFVQGDNFASLPPGDITVTLSGSLSLRRGFFGLEAAIETNSRGTAPSANLTIRAHDILVTENSYFSTQAFRTGAGGALNISTEQLQLTDGGQLRSGSTRPAVRSGQPPEIPSGAAGTITIQGLASPAQSILIDGQGSGIFTNTEGTGAGGNTNILAQSVTIQNGGTISASTSGTVPSATGGSIAINTTDQTTMTSGGSITASSTGPADAGNIAIHAGQQFEMRNSSVSTEAAETGGGNIDIQAVDRVRLTDSTISTSVLGGAGSGGNITIDPNLVLLQSSQILAQAVQGAGGNILITTNLLLPDANSTISASSQFGQSGTITIQSPIAPASGKIIPLSQKPLLATSLVNQRCAALAGGEFSSFTMAGRDSLPAEPGGWLESPLALALSEFGGGTVVEASDERLAPSSPSPLPQWQPPLAPPYQGGGDGEGETPLLSLRQIAPPGFLTQAFAVDWSAGCTS